MKKNSSVLTGCSLLMILMVVTTSAIAQISIPPSMRQIDRQ